ncbi:hypothetical protein, partial [Streptomyces griseus]|uniref:hypothetical protein n=1 Tax=Streptomyces griseus TaxID=1911 RepID=UPI001F3BD4B4
AGKNALRAFQAGIRFANPESRFASFCKALRALRITRFAGNYPNGASLHSGVKGFPLRGN